MKTILNTKAAIRVVAHTILRQPIGRLYILLLFSLFAIKPVSGSNVPEWVKYAGARVTPAEYVTGKSRVYFAEDYGAIADGKTLSTQSIQQAIDACATAGGGVVSFRGGQFLTGSLFLKENINFHLPAGVTLLGSTNIEDYPDIDTRVAGIEMVWPAALINALETTNVKISGKGTIHAQGEVFWKSYRDLRAEYEPKGLRWIVDYDSKRPRTILIADASDVTLQDVTIQQAGFWTIHLLYSTHCTVKGVTIQNNIGGHGPSTDGIDIDSSSYILVEECDIDCNDDNFCLKAGRDADGLRVNRPTEYIVIRNCLSRAGGGLITCGSETSGGIRYVWASGLRAEGTNVAFRFKSAMTRGGVTEHIYLQDIELEKVKTVIETTVNWHPSYSYSTLPEEYNGKDLPDHWKKMLESVEKERGIPHFCDIHFKNIRVQEADIMFEVVGDEDSSIERFSFDRIDANVKTMGTINHAADWNMKNSIVRPANGKEVEISNSRNVEFPSLLTSVKEENNGVWYSADEPLFVFTMPEQAGQLSFGCIVEGESKWVRDFGKKRKKEKGIQTVYSLEDPLLKKGKLQFTVVGLTDSRGIILEVEGTELPERSSLIWSYGGASGKKLQEGVAPVVIPTHCKYNIFSVEQSAFTIYYGESMDLKLMQIVTPVTSDIRLADEYQKESPLIYFNSGKKTEAPSLVGRLPLESGKKEYFVVYRQNDRADYNHFMLPALFKQETRR